MLRAQVSDRMQPEVFYTTFHFPIPGTDIVTTEASDWATNCPEYRVTAVQVMGVQRQPERLPASTEAPDPFRQRSRQSRKRTRMHTMGNGI